MAHRSELDEGAVSDESEVSVSLNAVGLHGAVRVGFKASCLTAVPQRQRDSRCRHMFRCRVAPSCSFPST